MSNTAPTGEGRAPCAAVAVETMQATIKRLNRRCQTAEAALADAERCIAHVNNGHPWCNGNLGRALLAWQWSVQRERIKELEAQLAALRPGSPP